MSRAGSFEGFFPTAPSVRQKRKRAADRDTGYLAPNDEPNGSFSPPYAQSTSPITTSGDPKRRRITGTDVDGSTRDSDDRSYLNGEAGDTANGIGSASSHNSTVSSHHSTVSSVFSAPGHPTVSSHNGIVPGSHTLTPATTHDFSPPGRMPSPTVKAALQPKTGADSLGHDRQSLVNPCQSAVDSIDKPPQTRIEARSGVGEIKGMKAVYDPELDPKLSSKDRRKFKVRYKDFGKDVRFRQ